MQNPAMQQMLQQIMQQPALMEAMTENAVNANPQLRQMLDADPRLRCIFIISRTHSADAYKIGSPSNLCLDMAMYPFMYVLQRLAIWPIFQRW